jgi:hypothetical protein
MLTLLLGVLSIWAIQKFGDMAGSAVALLCCSLSQVFLSEYKWYGVALVLLFYYCQNIPLQAICYAVLSVLWQWDMIIGWVTDGRFHRFLDWPHQLWGLLAFFPLALYNGKRGGKSGWFFSIFYPVHLLLIGWLANKGYDLCKGRQGKGKVAILVIAVIIGGLGDIKGALVGGIAIGVIEALVTGLIAIDLGPVGVCLALLVVLYLRPQGLFGKGERRA